MKVVKAKGNSLAYIKCYDKIHKTELEAWSYPRQIILYTRDANSSHYVFMSKAQFKKLAKFLKVIK